MGKFLVFTIGKLFSTPRRKAGMLSFFSGTCLDQQIVLWNKSSSEFLWYPARLSAVNAAMTVYINRGSHPKSVLLDVQRGVPKLCSLHVNVSSATGICSASEHPSRVSTPSRTVPGSLARWLGCQVPWSSLAAPGQALAPLNWPPVWLIPKPLKYPSSSSFEKSNEFLACASDQACARYAPKLIC